MTGISEQIRRLEDERYGAMKAGDVAALERLLDADMVYTHSSATADTKESYLAGVRSKLWEYQSIERSEETIVVRDNTALVFNRCKIAINVQGTPRRLDNRMLAVWSKSASGNWTLLALHSTPIPQA
jgi:ketosteroid isomerase-like protein